MITGCTGLICSAVADVLIRWNETHKEKINILAAARNEKKVETRFAPYMSESWFNFVLYDASSTENKLILPCDYIIHGASNASPNKIVKEPVETMLSNFTGMKYLLDYAKAMETKRVLYISSSEVYGKKEATKGVLAGICTSLTFILLSFLWVHYIPAESDWASGFVKGLFSNTPRMLLSSLIAYAISEWVDVQLYHAWWNLTEKKTGDHKKFLWFRNNFSTLISQFVNIVIFNFGAFWGIYAFGELVAITGACYIIYVVTSLLDTPFVYWGRKIAVVEPVETTIK